MPELPDDDAARLDEACIAIAATPARLHTLRVVMDGQDVTAKDVMQALGLTRSAVGYHLAALTEAGLIHERRATHPVDAARSSTGPQTAKRSMTSETH